MRLILHTVAPSVTLSASARRVFTVGHGCSSGQFAATVPLGSGDRSRSLPAAVCAGPGRALWETAAAHPARTHHPSEVLAMPFNLGRTHFNITCDCPCGNQIVAPCIVDGTHITFAEPLWSQLREWHGRRFHGSGDDVPSETVATA